MKSAPKYEWDDNWEVLSDTLMLSEYDDTHCPICGEIWTIETLLANRHDLIYAGNDQMAHRACWVNSGRKVNS